MTIEERYNLQKNKQNRYSKYNYSKEDILDTYIYHRLKIREQCQRQQEQEQLEAEITKTVEQAIEDVLKDFE